MQITITATVKQDVATVFEGFTQSLFMALKPPLVPLKLLRFDGCKKDDEVHLYLGFNQYWISIITQSGATKTGVCFIDEGVKLPFFLSYWKHTHSIDAAPNGAGAIITDHIEYQSPNVLLGYLLYPVLYAQFAYRKPVYRRIFGKP